MADLDCLRLVLRRAPGDARPGGPHFLRDPRRMAGGAMVIALLFAWSVKVALLEPFAVACMMLVHFRRIEGQTPDPASASKLKKLSSGFRERKQRVSAPRDVADGKAMQQP